jgi:hypothetical protein
MELETVMDESQVITIQSHSMYRKYTMACINYSCVYAVIWIEESRNEFKLELSPLTSVRQSWQTLSESSVHCKGCNHNVRTCRTSLQNRHVSTASPKNHVCIGVIVSIRLSRWKQCRRKEEGGYSSQSPSHCQEHSCP